MRAPKSYFRVLLCAVLFAAFAAAQQSKTPVTIVVTDPNGAVVPHAQVRLTPAPDPTPGVMETDEKGKLRVDLLPGEYSLSVSRAGFKRSDANVVVKRASDGQTITVSLEAGANPNIGQIGPTYVTSGPDILLSAGGNDHIRLGHTNLNTSPTTHNTHSNADETYSGVRLSDLLAKLGAPLGQQLRGTALKSYVVATGSDGYQAVFSLAEVDPTFHPGEILVADTLNGTPLDAPLNAKTGPFRLVITEDKRPARSVRNLVAIELKSAD